MSPLKVVLLSTYELGRQPFGLASPATWLRQKGYEAVCADLSVESLPTDALQNADLVAFYVPMHRATRLAVRYLPVIQRLNPATHLCFYGLYAPVNHDYLKSVGVDTTLGGEFEEGLLQLCGQLNERRNVPRLPETDLSGISLKRQKFLVPDRLHLPPLSKYARLVWNDETPSRLVGHVEASRGCKHRCTHCPVVPVYQGRFFVVQKEVVLEDIRQQVALGARHITFGDPDFFNGIGHSLPIVEAFHQEFPDLTYDVTIKVEHLLKHQAALGVLKKTGCLLITTAMESFDDQVLRYLRKEHTYRDFTQVLGRCESAGIHLNPTFVAFTPWTTLESYAEFLLKLRELGLVDCVAPIQLIIRLLIPAGSGVLELSDIQKTLLPFHPEQLSYPWKHSDCRVDQLHAELTQTVTSGITRKRSRQEIFSNVWDCVSRKIERLLPLFETQWMTNRASVPYLNEPWYC